MAGLSVHESKPRGRPGTSPKGTGRLRTWFRDLTFLKVVVLMAVMTGGLVRPAHAIENTATGSLGSSVLDTANATVTLNLVGSVVDPDNSSVTVDPPTVAADGTTMSTITIVLRDAANNPLPGRTVVISSDRGPAVDTIAQPPAPTDAGGTAVGTILSSTVGISAITVTETLETVVLSDHPQVTFTRGIVLDLLKMANKTSEVAGGVVTYTIEIRNRTVTDVAQVRIDDAIPPGFKYLRGTTRINGAAVPDPAGSRSLTFDVGTVPAFADSNGNGEADPGEPGYLALSYQLGIGSGAVPGEHVNTASAWDADPGIPISNTTQTVVTVTMDPLFDLGTIIGKVFEDRNGDGWQDEGETGIADAIVVLDDGTRITTDAYGRYHIPAVLPGHRLVKLDRGSLPAGAGVVGDGTIIVSVTPGLLVKANFRVSLVREDASIGRSAEKGLLMATEDYREPIHVQGSVEMLQVLVDGVNADLPGSDVVLGVVQVADTVTITGGRLEGPIQFRPRLHPGGDVREWRLTVRDSRGQVVKTIEGTDRVPEQIGWAGITDQGDLIRAGEIYLYQMEAWYRDGGYTASAVHTFGVNNKSFVSLDIQGTGFGLGSAALRPRTERLLDDVAGTLRKYPDEVVVIEGHTDSLGTEEVNLELSRRRAEAAYNYLVKVQKLDPDRFVVKWYGETRPAVSNEVQEGREFNRRVEIKGQLLEVKMRQLLNQYRTEPEVLIDGSPVEVDPDGRFQTSVQTTGEEGIRIHLVSETGAVAQGRVDVPDLTILEPRAEVRLGYGEEGALYTVGKPGPDERVEPGDRALVYRLVGKTDPPNTVQLGEENLPVDNEGVFGADLDLEMGKVNLFSLLVKNPAGHIRIARLRIRVTDVEDDGRLVVVRDPVPNLSVQLPPEGVLLRNPRLRVPGFTDPGNRVLINGRSIPVGEDGAFAVDIELVRGENTLRFEAVDPQGYSGVLERTVRFQADKLFFLAFADGKVGQLSGKGYLEGAGMKKDKEFYQEGRAAYYLKGTVAGRYLITSAFDSGTGEFGDLFTDLDEGDRDRFFTNLDPDKYYPVYGDASTVEYDVQTQGKFYLAVDSEELHLLLGNYSLDLSDTELTAYKRTLYGGNLVYRSLARSKYGDHDTVVVLFGAQARFSHIRDELRATGGSLYYLSRREVTEGSEQVSLIIRDKTTGLVLAEIPQRRSADYLIRYAEGRLLFNRPLSSVVQDDTIINDALLAGDPVSVQVDYEVRAENLERTGSGGRVRKQVGDHLSIGGTYVSDELESGGYDLSGVDARVRLSEHSWIKAETARSSGSDSPVYVSEDGGLTWTEAPPSSTSEGTAFHAAARLDVGELFGTPRRLEVGAYIKRLEPGFQSSANHAEEGVVKYGTDFSIVVSGKDTVSGQYDERDHLDPLSVAPGMEDEARTASLQWAHRREKMGLILEYRASESEDNAGNLLERTGLAAALVEWNPGEKTTVYLEQQTTVTGPENDQSKVGIRYQVTPSLSLGASGTHGTKGSSYQGEANLNVAGSRLYATERLTDDDAGHSSASVVGAETTLDSSTNVYTENQWERTGEGVSRQVSLVGARRKWDVAPGLSAVLSGESSKTTSSAEETSRYALSSGVSYNDPERVEASVRGEVRREKGSRETVQYLTANRFKIMLSPDYSVLGRYNYSVTRDLDVDEVKARFEERSVGLAYRPVAWDRLNLLSKYTVLRDLAPDTLDTTASTDTFTRVLSIEWSYDLTHRLEWVEKDAVKTSEEQTGDWAPVRSRTALNIHRLNYNFVDAWDLGLEYRLRSVDITDDSQTGWLAELMYALGDHFRIGLGYNFTDFSDNEFSENDYSVRGTFLRFQGKY